MTYFAPKLRADLPKEDDIAPKTRYVQANNKRAGKSSCHVFHVAFAGLTLAACVAGCNVVENVKEALPKRNIEDGAARIDARVDATLEQMYLEYPETVQLSARASGVLIMPLI